MNKMRLFKTLGYLNILSRCFYSHVCKAEGVMLRNFFSTQRLSDKPDFFNEHSFKLENDEKYKKMEPSHPKEEVYPKWAYEKSPNDENYKIIERRYNKNFNFVYTVYEHKRTKTQILFIGTNDPLDIEQGFVFYVKTLPYTDKGIPHILEHSVLAGSKKYKNPFNTLMKGSLFTFLNAGTYNDRTVYYARSMNNKDFFNILEVYIDCVFNPTVLQEETYFRQEGWTYVLEPLTEEEKNDKNIPKIKDFKVSYGGVVFSEMKGAYSNPQRILIHESEKLLFPDNVHSNESGGDPEVIPNLTYNEFIEFYYKNYNPQKIKLFASSNRSSQELLERVDEYLKTIDLSLYRDETGEIDNVEFQKYKEGPFYKIKKYANSAQQKESLVLISWVINPVQKKKGDPDLSLDVPLDSFVLSIVNYLLVQNPSSVLHKALIESGLGTGVLSDMLDNEIIQHMFSVGLKGIMDKNSTKEKEKREEEEKEEEMYDIDDERDEVEKEMYENERDENEKDEIKDDVHLKVEKVVMDALNKVVETGFNKNAVEAAFNSFEFRLKEMNLDNAKTTKIVLEMISKMNYNRDPLETFEYDIYLNKIRKNIDEIPNYLENFVKKYLIENKHRAVVLLKGDENIGKEMMEKEQKSLKKRIEKMSEQEKEKIIQDFDDLRKAQKKDASDEEKEDNIPTLNKSDLNEKTLEIPATLYVTDFDKNKNDFEEYEKIKKNKKKAEKNMQWFKERYVLKKEKNPIFTEDEEDKEDEKNFHFNFNIEKDIPILIHEIPTDGIIYLDISTSLDHFDLEDFYYLKLFKSIILENKTSKRSEEDFINLKEKTLGRLKSTINTYSKSYGLKTLDKYNAEGLFSLELHVLNHKCGEGIKIAMEAFLESDMSNKKKVIELLERSIDNYRTSFSEDAEYIVMTHIRSHLNSVKYLKDILTGYSNYLKVLEILQLAKKDFSLVEKKLKDIRKKLLNTDKIIITVTADENSIRHLFVDSKNALKNFLSHFKNLGKKKDTKIKWNEEIKKKNVLNDKEKKDILVTESLVNYVGVAGVLFETNEFLNPSYEVVVAAIKNNYAWQLIREVNGAYGVFSNLSYDGVLCFCSYRDPQLEKTLQVYKDLSKGAREMADKMSEKDLLRYIIYIIRRIDAPKRGVELGKTSYWRILGNETEDDRIEYRKHVMNTTKKDFYDFADLLDRKAEEMEKNITIVTNPENSKRFVASNPEFKIIPLE